MPFSETEQPAGASGVHPDVLAAPDSQRGPATRFCLIFLSLLAAAVYIGSSPSPALLDDADASHAGVAAAMLQRHDWTVLYMNGFRYLQKAPLQYWAVAGTYALLGRSAFATRISLALSVIGLVLALYFFGRRYFGRRAGFYAALAACTSFGMFLFTRIMIPEAMVALEFTLAFYLFLRAWNREIPPRAGYWSCAALIALAVLTKGLIGLVFPAGAIVFFILVVRGWDRWRELHLFSSILIFLAIALPWHVLAEMRSPGFFWWYFVNEHVLRALGKRWPPDYDAIPLPLWWLAHFAWLFPWSFFAGFAVREIPSPRSWGRHMTAEANARLLIFLWAAIILVFFSVESGSRMEYYSFPAWPALCLFIGLGLARAEERGSRWLARLQGAIALAGLLAASVLGYVLWVSRHVRASGDVSQFLEEHPVAFYRVSMAHFLDLTPDSFALLRGQALLAALLFSVGFGGVWLLRRRGRNFAATLALSLVMGAFLLTANWAYQVFEPYLSSHALALAVNRELRPQDQIVIYGEYGAGSSLCFYTNRPAWIYNGDYNNLAMGAIFPDSPHIFLDDQTFPAFWQRPERVFLFVPPEQREAAVARLPANHAWLFAQSGGKSIYVNQPLTPGQLPVALPQSSAQ